MVGLDGIVFRLSIIWYRRTPYFRQYHCSVEFGAWQLWQKIFQMSMDGCTEHCTKLQKLLLFIKTWALNIILAVIKVVKLYP
ncbi:hypothetical protein HRbin02_01894 [Candidatus Calditenuaceae archaeon HR02]|nr:hypothetical protein HRbin02_01894 [Candidatus Calditenuaceae archaeon HR02]